MVRKSTAESLGVAEGTVIEDTAEPAPWEAASEAASQVQVYAATPAASWRRKLTGAELLQYVAAQVRNTAEDESAMGLDIFDRIAGAASVDAILGEATETTKGRDILDVGLECRNIRFVMGDKDGCPYFSIVDVRRTDTGEIDTLSLGGWKVVAQLGMFHYLASEFPPGSPFLVPEGIAGALAREPLPVYFKIIQTELANGNTMNHLVSLMR